jgi:hypothetical protein
MLRVIGYWGNCWGKDWKIEKLKNWKIGKLEDWKIRKSWKIQKAKL